MIIQESSARSSSPWSPLLQHQDVPNPNAKTVDPATTLRTVPSTASAPMDLEELSVKPSIIAAQCRAKMVRLLFYLKLVIDVIYGQRSSKAELI